MSQISISSKHVLAILTRHSILFEAGKRWRELAHWLILSFIQALDAARDLYGVSSHMHNFLDVFTTTMLL